MTIEVEMQAMPRNKLNGINFHLESNLLFSVGDDSFVKVWDYSFMREPHQVYIVHARNINDVCYHDGKVWSVGCEGILVWNFTNQGENQGIEPPVYAKEKKAAFIKNQHNTLQERESQLNYQEEGLLGETRKERNNEMSENKVVFSNLIKKNVEN